jgi:hypothetical protein
VLGRAPAALQLRYLQTLSEIGGEGASTIVFPLPIDLIKPLLESAQAPPSAVPEQANGELPEGARVGELPQPQ